jgi:catechol 2,3-dioxygenase-like lactoylglutathione lyase family enzyme
VITSVARVALLCRSVDKRRGFWEGLGFSPVYEGRLPDGRPLLHLGLATQDGVGLWLIEADGDDQLARVGRQTGSQPLLVLYSSDLDADLEAAVSAGGEVMARGGDETSEWSHVRDPDGNVIVVARLLA